MCNIEEPQHSHSPFGIPLAPNTSTTALTFMLAMAMFPDAQKKLQAELDRVVGPDRLPEYDDLENMPYLRATVMETIRWLPVLPLSIPHAVTADDVYKGYFIPKGATVFGNAWAIHMDPMRYANPTVFDPDRFYTPGQPTPWSNGPAGARDQCVLSPSIAPCMQDR